MTTETWDTPETELRFYVWKLPTEVVGAVAYSLDEARRTILANPRTLAEQDLTPEACYVVRHGSVFSVLILP